MREINTLQSHQILLSPTYIWHVLFKYYTYEKDLPSKLQSRFNGDVCWVLKQVNEFLISLHNVEWKSIMIELN